VSRFPVIEIFGPTLQGEGPDAGLPCFFVRFGGCDYRCRWCDSLHAVDPASVRQGARHLSTSEIVAEVESLGPGPKRLVLTGGNPALLALADLVESFHRNGFEVAVETQGSRWKPWLEATDQIVASPKPPSSGIDQGNVLTGFAAFMSAAEQGRAALAIKIVIFDEADLAFARAVHAEYPGVPFWLSVGTDCDLSDNDALRALSARYQWLWRAAARCDDLANVRVLPQLHVVAWGQRLGV
jgi:7-carboxy-7-deazaguanine synthase